MIFLSVFIAPLIAFFLVRKNEDTSSSQLEEWILYTALFAGAIVGIILMFFKP